MDCRQVTNLHGKQGNSNFRSKEHNCLSWNKVSSGVIGGSWQFKAGKCLRERKGEKKRVIRGADWQDGGRRRECISCVSFWESLSPCVFHAQPRRGKVTEAGTGAEEWWAPGSSEDAVTLAGGERRWVATRCLSFHPALSATGSPGWIPSWCWTRARFRCPSCSRSDLWSPGLSLTPGPASPHLSSLWGSAGLSQYRLPGRLLPDSAPAQCLEDWPPPFPFPPMTPRCQSDPLTGSLGRVAGRVWPADHPPCRLSLRFAPPLPSHLHLPPLGGAQMRKGEAAGKGCSAEGWGRTGRGRGSQEAVWGSCWERRPLGGRGWSPRGSQRVGCAGTGPAGTGVWNSTGHLGWRKIQGWRLTLRRTKGFLTYNIQECSLIMLNGISNSNQKPQGPILARLLLTKKKTKKTKTLMVHLCMPVLWSGSTSHRWKPDVCRFYSVVKTKTATTTTKKSNN